MSLLDCFHKLMAYIFLFVKYGAPGQPSHELMRQRVTSMLEEASRRASRLDIPDDHFLKAEFAVCTWIDELLISSQWENRYAWVAQLLQRERYGISNAGELFFEKLAALSTDEKDVREVYLACLSFGFEGRFFGQDNSRERHELRLREIRDVYGKTHQAFPAVMFPDARPPLPHRDRVQRAFKYKKPLIACAAASCAVFLIWGVYSLVLSRSLDGIFASSLL